MPSMRTLLLLLTVQATVLTQGQSAVRIVSPNGPVNVSPVYFDATVEAALAAAGSSEEQVRAVKAANDIGTWPVGIRSDSARASNAALITTYTAYRVCSFPRDQGMMAVVWLPAKENTDMHEDLCPDSDVYLVLPENALRSALAPRPRPVASKGPSWQNRAKVKIEEPERVYAAYDIAADSAAVQALREAGMSQVEIDAVAYRSTERNWPDGIDSFEKRWPDIDLFKKYRAYLGASWGSKTLLIVPVEENLKMPPPMRPYMDMYFVYDAEAVAVKTR